MNRPRNTESNGGIFVLIPCTEPTIQGNLFCGDRSSRSFKPRFKFQFRRLRVASTRFNFKSFANFGHLHVAVY